MFGCRRCDYDICESCVDKKEGARLKWSWCKDKCKAIEEKFISLTPKLPLPLFFSHQPKLPAETLFHKLHPQLF